MRKLTLLSMALFLAIFLASSSFADDDDNNNDCEDLPSHAELKAALEAVVDAGNNSGLENEMWGTVVNRDGVVCAVVFSGDDRGDQWPGSRAISAQKANTANAFSRPSGVVGFAGPLSTANLFSAVQPGNSLFGLQFSNPVDTKVAYKGNAKKYGKTDDPMVGKKIGGVNVFGGGLALYDSDGELVGALGVSGDTSCTDHIIAWKVRDSLGLDHIPGGVNQPDPEIAGTDNIIHDVTVDANTGHTVSMSGFGHPECDDDATIIAEDLPDDFPVPVPVIP